MRRSPFRIAAPWSPCLSFYVNIAGGGGVGRQPLSRKSRVREFYVGFTAIQFAHASFASAADITAAIRHNRYTKHIFQGVISS
jgi:hypothetical protein